MRIVFTLGFIALMTVQAVAASRYAVASGAWSTAIWAATPGGAAGSAATPTAIDDVFTNGRLVSITAAGATCRNLFVTYNVSGSIALGAGRTITVTGSVTGWDDSVPGEEFPTTNVVTYGINASLTFTGANMDPNYDPYVVYFWDNTIPFGRVNFNFGIGNSRSVFFPLTFSALTTVQSGILAPDPGTDLSGAGTGTLQINSGATVSMTDPIASFATITQNGTLSTTSTISATNMTVSGALTSSNAITISALLTVNSTGSINTSGSISTVNATLSGPVTTSNFFNTSGTLTLNPTGSISTSYTGGSEGWWSGTNRPGTLNIDAASTVTYSASAGQNVYAQDYGNLTLGGSGTLTKTLVGAGTLNVKGNLTIGSSAITFNSNSASAITIGGNLVNSGIWIPTDLISFNGTGSQTFPGAAAVTFSGGIQINKTTGTAALNHDVSISGITVSQGTLDLGSTTVTLPSGNISNSGTLTASTSTIIIGGTTSVTGSSTTTLNNLTINATKSFTAANNLTVAGSLLNNGIFNGAAGTVNINGSFANSSTGSFVHNGGTVVLGGSATQTVSGAGAINFNNLTVNNASGVSNDGIILMNGGLTLTSGAFDADGLGSGSFTLLSSGLTTGGKINALTIPSDFSGNVTIQRKLPASADWRYLALPLLTNSSGGSINVGQWKASMPVTGQFSDPSPTGVGGVSCASPGTTACASIFSYNPVTSSFVAVGSGSSTSSTNLDYRKGYSVYQYSGANNPISVTGTIVTGAVTIPLTVGGDNYNLIPNPYPSPIDWDNVSTGGTTNTVYMTTAQGSFATYLKGSGMCTGCSFNTGWRGELAMSQSFYIQTTGATSIAMTESAKTTSSATFVREGAPDNYFRVILKDGSKEDDMIVRFLEDATPDLEYTFDAVKKTNANFINLSSYNSDPAIDFAINALPVNSCNSSVKLKLSNVPAGSYVLGFTELETLQKGYKVVLIDHFLNQTKAIDTGDEYKFSISSDPATFENGRFEIVSTKQLQSLATVTDGQRCGAGSVTLSAAGASTDGSYHWYTAIDAASPIADVTSNQLVTEDLNSTKDYYVSMVDALGCESSRTKVVAKIVNTPVPVITVEGTTLKSDNPSSNQWYKDGLIIEGATEPTLDVRESGTYTVAVVSEGCTATSEGRIMMITGLEKDNDSEIRLFPNPVVDQLTISVPLDLQKKIAGIQLVDAKGQEVQTTVHKQDLNGEEGRVINMRDVTPGMYIVKIISGEKILAFKIIKK